MIFPEQSELDKQGRQYLTQMAMQFDKSTSQYEISLPVDDVKTEFSPMIAEPLQSTVSVEGEEARFQVRLASMPEPEIAWYQNGKLVGPEGTQKSPKYRFYYETRAHSHTRGIVISSLSEEDAGQYELRAWNKLGQVACSATLNVKGKQDVKEIKKTKTFQMLHQSLAKKQA